MADNTEENRSTVVHPGNIFFGRRDIYATEEDLTEDNVVAEVNSALVYHLMNVTEEDYLYWYRRGFQPVLSRTKQYNDFVCNKVVVNISNEITEFKSGYLLQEPAAYTSRKSGKKTKVDKLNEYLYRSGKHTADNQLADWFHMVGKAALYVESSDDLDAPVKAYALDPRSAFVVYSLKPGNRPVYAVNVVLKEAKAHIDVYTENKIFRLVGGGGQKATSDYKDYYVSAAMCEKVEENPLGHIPIIEYRYNSVNMSSFEACLPLLDALSDIQSNRCDGIAQFIQSIIVAVNCNFEEGTTANKIKEAGMIALSAIGDNKADFKILSEELNQDQTQTLVDNLYDQVLHICSMPSTTKGHGSTSDNVGAVIFRDGWEQAASSARNTEDLFKESNRYFDRILVDVLKRKGILDIKTVDFELNFVRNEVANVQSKAQAAQTMMAMGLAPELALKKSGLSSDPVSDVKMSEKYLRMIWGDPDAAVKAEEKPGSDGRGEAIVVEEDNNNGEDAEGNA